MDNERMLPATTGGAQAALQTAEIAQMQSIFMMAQQVPRDRDQIAAEVKKACQSPALAEKAVYMYRRGGQLITGPSVKLIEEIAQIYGRFRAGWRMLRRLDNATEIYIYAIDIQTLNVSDLVLIVEDPQFKSRAASSEDCYLNCANMAARRKRACMERILPTALKDDAVSQCEETLKNAHPDFKSRLGKMVEVFESEFGVSKDQIESFLQCKVESAAIQQYVKMRAIYTSLADGAAKPNDFFRGAPSVVVQPKEDAKKKGKQTQKPKNDPPPNVEAESVKEVKAEEKAADPKSQAHSGASTTQTSVSQNSSTDPAATAQTNTTASAADQQSSTAQSDALVTTDAPDIQEDEYESDRQGGEDLEQEDSEFDASEFQ